jgi:hypothetical protein
MARLAAADAPRVLSADGLSQRFRFLGRQG